MSAIPIRKGKQLDYMRAAGKIAAEVLRLTAAEIHPGVTTKEIDEAAAQFIAERGCTSAFLGYRGFPGHTCISMNEEVVHGIGSARVIQDGDIVKLDVGIVKDGWVGDNAKTIAVGTMTPATEQLLFATEESLQAAIDLARDGVRLAQLCAAVEKCVDVYGYTVVKEFVGHGVGKKLHEEPQVPNHWDKSSMGKGPRLRAGMILAIEPMVNAGGPEVRVLEDQWTVETADRSLSAHFEHTVLITDDAPEILTYRERSVPRLTTAVAAAR
ncbi:MAG: type I methionyl aminopeptidase [Verrucomicrobiales bacterium]|nr:type I methionyl aminopeptidase [Verrucomicrobiales bacterium]